MNNYSLDTKIFYIGFQRVGTKSFGMFMELNNYRVASWEESSQNKWGEMFVDGRFNDILHSYSFKTFQVFEDAPWFQPEFVKFLYHELPNSKFILLTRPPEDWFKSMVTHSSGLNLGNVFRHCALYDRLDDYEWIRQYLIDSNDFRISIFDSPNHYMNVYKKKTIELKLFFDRMHDSYKRVYVGELYNKNVYKEIADFLDIKNPLFLQSRVHKSKIKASKVASNLNLYFDHAFNTNRQCSKDPQKNIIIDLEVLFNYLRVSPNNQNILRRISDCYYKLSNLNKAEYYINKSIEISNNNSKLFFLKGKINIKQNKINDAICALKKAIELNSEIDHYQKLLSEIQK